MNRFLFLLLIFSVTGAFAQENQNVFVRANSPRHDRSVQPETFGYMKGYINYVNSKAERHLLKNFGDANSIHWEIDDLESTAYFTRGEEHVKVRYDKDGHYISTRKTYPGNKLDRYIDFMSKKNLDKDFSISGVTELRMEAGNVYEIILQNKYYWCVVRIAEDRDGFLERMGENEIFLKV